MLEGHRGLVVGDVLSVALAALALNLWFKQMGLTHSAHNCFQSIIMLLEQA